MSLAAYSCAQLEEISVAAASVHGRAQVHLQVETGMSRGGADCEWRDLVALAVRLEQRGAIEVVGVWSHLACADEPGSPVNDEQLADCRDTQDAPRVSGPRGRQSRLSESNRRPSHYE